MWPFRKKHKSDLPRSKPEAPKFQHDVYDQITPHTRPAGKYTQADPVPKYTYDDIFPMGRDEMKTAIELTVPKQDSAEAYGRAVWEALGRMSKVDLATTNNILARKLAHSIRDELVFERWTR